MAAVPYCVLPLVRSAATPLEFQFWLVPMREPPDEYEPENVDPLSVKWLESITVTAFHVAFAADTPTTPDMMAPFPVSRP